MADQIPTAGIPDLTPQALPTPFNGNRATAEDFGSDAGDSVQHVGALANQLAVKARDNANVSAVLDARGTADTALNQQILDDKTGFRSLHGHDAMAGSDQAVGNFDKTLGQIGGSLSNDEQRRAFAQYALQLKQEAFRHVQGHLAQETQTVDADAYKTAVGAVVQRLGALPVAMDPVQQQKALADLELTARVRAVQVLGKSASPAEIANFTVQAKARGVDQTLETLLANENAPGALARAKQIIQDPQTAQLLGGARTAIIEGRIFRRADQQEGVAWARAAAQGSVYPGTSMISDDADDKLTKLANLPDSRPEMVKVAENELQRLKVRGRQVQKDRNDSAFTIGINAVHKGDDDAFQRAVDILSVPNAGTDAGEKLKTLYDFQATQNRRDSRSPEVVRAQANAFNDAQTLLGSVRASDMTIDSFLSNNKANDGRTLAEALSPTGLVQIGAKFTEKQKHEAADKPLDGGVTRQIAGTLQEALDFPTSPQVGLTDQQIAQRNHIQDHVRAQRNQWLIDNPNKQPGAEDYQGWINEETGKVPGTAPHLWSSDRRRVDLELEQLGAAPAPGAAQAQPQAPVQAQAALAPVAAPAPKAAAPAPDAQDQAAIDWLQKNPNGPAADKVRAKLKAKGLVQ